MRVVCSPQGRSYRGGGREVQPTLPLGGEFCVEVLRQKWAKIVNPPPPVEGQSKNPLPPWREPYLRAWFANLNVRCFQEVRRYVSFMLLSRIIVSVNTLKCARRDSDAAVLSCVRKQWMKLLFPT